jgi:hypothetical protein
MKKRRHVGESFSGITICLRYSDMSRKNCQLQNALFNKLQLKVFLKLNTLLLASPHHLMQILMAMCSFACRVTSEINDVVDETSFCECRLIHHKFIYHFDSLHNKKRLRLSHEINKYLNEDRAE